MPVDLAALGGFFSAELHDPASRPARPWQPMVELVDDPAVLAERIEQVRHTLAAGRPLATVHPRVAASVCQLGLATRLLSPALASAAAGCPIEFDWTALRWQPGSGGAFPLSVQPGSTSGFAEQAHRTMATLEAVANEIVPISPVVFWGNVGSALNGAVTMLVRLRPELAEAGYQLALAALGETPAATAGLRLGPGSRRRSCCLLYRASPYGRAACCPDCVLSPS